MARRAIPQNEILQLLEYAHQDSVARVLRAEVGDNDAGVNLFVGYDHRSNQVLAGHGYDADWSGAQPLSDRREPDIGGRATISASHAAAALSLNANGIEEAQLVATKGAVGAWVGRRATGFAVGHGGAIVMSGHRFDGVGVFLTRPLNLPVFGAMRFEMQLSKIKNRLNFNNAENEIEPFFWLARGSIEPISGVTLGINRGMMFGGEGNYPITARRLFNNLIGLNYTANGENAFAQQEVSVDLKIRPPVGWPALLYIEWGAEDAAGGWWHEPGILAGIEAGFARDAKWMIGLERTEIAFMNERSNGIWYQNAWFRDGWSDDGAIFGHPIGGHGREWRVFAHGSSQALQQTRVSGYKRFRGTQNVFVPQRAGSSIGATAELNVALRNLITVGLSGEYEKATGESSWNTTVLHLRLTHFF